MFYSDGLKNSFAISKIGSNGWPLHNYIWPQMQMKRNLVFITYYLINQLRVPGWEKVEISKLIQKKNPHKITENFWAQPYISIQQ